MHFGFDIKMLSIICIYIYYSFFIKKKKNGKFEFFIDISIMDFHHNMIRRKGIAPIKWNATIKFINILGIAFGMKYIHLHSIIHRDLKNS